MPATKTQKKKSAKKRGANGFIPDFYIEIIMRGVRGSEKTKRFETVLKARNFVKKYPKNTFSVLFNYGRYSKRDIAENRSMDDIPCDEALLCIDAFQDSAKEYELI